MKLSGSKKILLLGMILLIVAGIVVVSLKGVKVSLRLQQHEVVNVYLEKKIDSKEFRRICKEVFGNKTFEVTTMYSEIFGSSFDFDYSVLMHDGDNVIYKYQ